MFASSLRFHCLKKLRDYVNQILCHKEQLEPNAFELTERMLMRSGKPCGILFCLHGPRAVKFTAIWETERNTILFYTSSGERYHRAQLVQAPQLDLEVWRSNRPQSRAAA